MDEKRIEQIRSQEIKRMVAAWGKHIDEQVIDRAKVGVLWSDAPSRKPETKGE